MKFSLSSGLVRQSLAGHSWLGLMASALMYLVCITGIPVVFMHELGRWEQPELESAQTFEETMLATAYQEVISSNPDHTGSVYINLPTDDLPRMMISTGLQTWLVNDTGNLQSEVAHPFIDQLIALHVHLHLPRTVGVIIVSILGALLCALIVSGIAAHPRIFKDAFSFRTGGSERLQQVDMHNRLSVWNLPFQLIIAISGAFFGLYNFALMAVAFTHNDGNSQALLGTIYGQGVEIEQPIIPPDFNATLKTLKTIAPSARPFQITVEKANTGQQYLQVTARHPQRLIYGEEYYFSPDGKLLEKHGFSDGPTGRQILFSIHSLHLGDYGGIGIKILYGVLGLAMTVVCASGFNIWLKRRNKHDWLNNAWSGFVWGVPTATILAAIGQILLGLSATGIFWGGLFFILGYSQWRNKPDHTRKALMYALAVLLLIFVTLYGLVFGAESLNALSVKINLFLIATAILIILIAKTQARKKPASSP